MGCQDMKINLNKNKNIGKVLFIVEGESTEFYILSKIFNKIFDYQYETIKRKKPYEVYNSKIDPLSRAFVINTENSSIKSIQKNKDFLDNLFKQLIEDYDFNVDNAAIYYLFDRDRDSNTDISFIKYLLNVLKNSRENDNYNEQGLFLLSYPSLESFIFSNFVDNSFIQEIKNGDELKQYLNNCKINQSKINEKSLINATNEMIKAFNCLNILDYDLDDFGSTNNEIFIKQECHFNSNGKYRLLSLLCIALLDLGLISIEI